MRYKIRIVLTVISVLLLSAIIIGHAENNRGSEPLRTAMKAAGANVEEMSVNAWAKVPGAGQSDIDLENMARQSIEQLGIDRNSYTISQNQTEQQRMVRAEAVADYFHAVALAEAIFPQGEQGKAEVYLVVMVEKKLESETDLDEWQKKISAVIKDCGGKPRISTCLVGWLDGKLMDGEYAYRISNGFRTVNATIIDKVNYDNFASYTGFAPGISDYLEVGGKKINFNMAMRYSPYDDRTYITIGSPVITREY